MEKREQNLLEFLGFSRYVVHMGLLSKILFRMGAPILLCGFSAIVISCENSKSKSDSEPTDETATPPDNIAGTYLTCSNITVNSALATSEIEVGCKMADARTGEKANIDSITKSVSWEYVNELEAGSTISVTQLPNDPDYHAKYFFKASEVRQAESTIDKTYVKIPVTTSDGSKLLLGSPLRDTLVSHYMTGDFDGDGFVDLLDRNQDGSVDFFLYSPDEKATFPFKKESTGELNWSYTHYIAADAMNDPLVKHVVIARNFEGGIVKLFEHGPQRYTPAPPGKTWSDPVDIGDAESPSFYTDYSHSVVGRFNGEAETIFIRKTDGRMEHRSIVNDAPGIFIGDKWNYEEFVSGDFNDDGFDDLLTINLDGSADVHLNSTLRRGQQDITFQAPTKINAIDLSSCTSFVSADFLGSKYDQIVCRTKDGKLHMLVPTVNSGVVQWTVRADIGTNWQGLAFFAMDSDKDGRWEFVARTDKEEIKSIEFP
ncbi:MAG: hypothetical protein AB7T49_14575 [Oligoflexales bacterium]